MYQMTGPPRLQVPDRLRSPRRLSQPKQPSYRNSQHDHTLHRHRAKAKCPWLTSQSSHLYVLWNELCQHAEERDPRVDEEAEADENHISPVSGGGVRKGYNHRWEEEDCSVDESWDGDGSVDPLPLEASWCSI